MKVAEQALVAFYMAQLKRLGLTETAPLVPGSFPLLMKQWKLLGWVVHQKVVGHVTKKPTVDTEGNIKDFFQAVTGTKGPVWDLAGAIEVRFGCESEIMVGPEYM